MKLEAQLDKLIDEETSLDSILINYTNGKRSVPVIIKSSVLLSKKMMSKLGNRNIIVFPECQETSLYYLIAMTVYSISTGDLSMQYDPYSFTAGEKLKIDNCIVEFVRCGVESIAGSSVERIRIRCGGDSGSSLEISLPLDNAPYFQKVNTSRRLSPYRKVNNAIKRHNGLGAKNNFIESLSKFKTHMSSSVIYVSSVAKTKDFLAKTRIGNKPVSDYFSIGNINYEGNVGNVFSGQLGGVPAIVLSSQIGYVEQALMNGLSAQSILINLDEINIESDLDFLDEVLAYNTPIVCMAGAMNSFNMESLKARNFNIWRWDKNTLTNRIAEDTCYSSAFKVRNCKNKEVIFIKVESDEINAAFRLINKHKSIAEDGTPLLLQAYSYLLRLSISTIHNITMSSAFDGEALKKELENCETVIAEEKFFISESAREDLIQAIQLLGDIYLSHNKVFPKADELCNIIRNSRNKNIIVVISEDEEISRTNRYIESNFMDKNSFLSYNVSVMYPNEYINSRQSNTSIVIVVGWLGRSVMEKILYSFNAPSHYILIYDCENVWKNAHVRRWTKTLQEDHLQGIEKELFDVKDIEYDHEIISTENSELTTEEENEQEGIEYVLRTSRYRRYEGEDKEKTVMVTPVSFVGGYFALYTSNHTVIRVTKIIEEDANDFELVDVQKLHIGDFVAVRESSKSLIRDVADQILDANNMGGIRALATKWKESLEVEMVFSSFEDVYEKVKEAGCTKGAATVKNWVSDDEMIIPRDKEDLIAIAIATNDDVLIDRIDEIYDAGSTVKRAHIKAGRLLAEEMKQCIVEKLSKEEIDPFNIWGPIEIAIERIGTVKLLKITDVDHKAVNVNDRYTNRLLTEEKEVILWQE